MRISNRASSLSRRGAVFLLLGCSVSACGEKDQTAAAAEPRPAIEVTVAPVAARQAVVTIDATGSFAADESSDVAPEVSGRVVQTPVDVGAFVRRGDVLVRLRAVDAGFRLDEAQAAERRAEASVALAESQNTLARTTAERYSNLLATGDVSRTLADQARTEAETQQQTVATMRASLAEARAQLALAQKAVDDVVVTAPFAGFISARPVSVGEYVQPSNPIVTLVAIDPLRLQLNIPGVQAGRIIVGQQVSATVDAFAGRSFTGAITAVSPSVDPQSRSFTVEARVQNPDAVLKPGMFAVASIDRGVTELAYYVPRAAVAEDINTDSFRVFVIDDQNRARLRVVQIDGLSTADPVRLVEGVQRGERVATSRLGDLYDGALVTITGTPSTSLDAIPRVESLTATAMERRLPHAKAR